MKLCLLKNLEIVAESVSTSTAADGTLVLRWLSSAKETRAPCRKGQRPMWGRKMSHKQPVLADGVTATHPG